VRDGRAHLFEAESYVHDPATDFAVQCRPRLVVDGHNNLASDTGRRAARTALCLRDAGQMLDLVVVPAEQDAGPTLYELAEALIAHGCHDALNLDGGPSTGAFWNDPSGSGALAPPGRSGRASWFSSARGENPTQSRRRHPTNEMSLHEFPRNSPERAAASNLKTARSARALSLRRSSHASPTEPDRPSSQAHVHRRHHRARRRRGRVAGGGPTSAASTGLRRAPAAGLAGRGGGPGSASDRAHGGCTAISQDPAVRAEGATHVELVFDCAPGDWTVTAGERSKVFVLASSPIEAAAAIERTCLWRG
jgi:hypothetical protein